MSFATAGRQILLSSDSISSPSSVSNLHAKLSGCWLQLHIYHTVASISSSKLSARTERSIFSPYKSCRGQNNRKKTTHLKSIYLDFLCFCLLTLKNKRIKNKTEFMNTCWSYTVTLSHSIGVTGQKGCNFHIAMQ